MVVVGELLVEAQCCILCSSVRHTHRTDMAFRGVPPLLRTIAVLINDVWQAFALCLGDSSIVVCLCPVEPIRLSRCSIIQYCLIQNDYNNWMWCCREWFMHLTVLPDGGCCMGQAFQLSVCLLHCNVSKPVIFLTCYATLTHLLIKYKHIPA